MQRPFFAIAAIIVLSTASYWTTLAQTQPPHVIAVNAKKYEFMPSEIHVKQGEKVELRVHSLDVTHGIKLDLYPEGAKSKGAPGLVFDQPDANGKVQKGEDQILDFTAQEPGTYDFKCARICGMGHGRMKGKLIVDPS